MKSSHRSIVAIAVATALAVPTLAAAQRQHTAALGDLMTAFVQPRHIKLGLAGKERNWLYAAYELDQLRETLADVAEILAKISGSVDPRYDRVDCQGTAGCTDRGNPG